jgi:hypothetical protein
MESSASFGSSALSAEVRALLRLDAIEQADLRVHETLARAPQSAEAWYLRGLIANRRRDHESAIVALRTAVGLRPDAAPAWLALGTALTRFDKLPDAAEAYRAAAEREPGWADAHFNLGVVLKRQGDRRGAAHAMHAAWVRDPMMFEAASQCVAIVADCVRTEGWPLPAVPPSESGRRPSFTVVICSIDRVKRDYAVALYRRLFAGCAHEIDTVWCPRSLAEAYNAAVARSSADIVVLSHDDVDVLASDFAIRLARGLAKFDALGVVGSTRLDGPAVGWSGHPHLRGWITHRAAGESTWRVDVLDPHPVADGIAILDGVLIAARRELLKAVPFDANTFDAFHLYDLDWTYRASRAGFRLGVAGELLVVHASRGDYGAAWQRQADRFCAKHHTGQAAPAASSFFGAALASADQARRFFAILAHLSESGTRNVSNLLEN